MTEPTEDEMSEFLGIFEPGSGKSPPDWATAEQFPRLFNISAAFVYRAVLRADEPSSPEYVTIPMRGPRAVELQVKVAEWNMLWEAAQFRRRFFDLETLPPRIGRVADTGDVNVVFVPRTRSRYYEYAPLFHLLPRSALQRQGLPLLRSGQWPFLIDNGAVDDYLPADFERRLGHAWAAVTWRHLMPGSAMSGFTKDDPIRLLAHNLDFWLPPVTRVIEDIMRTRPEVDNGIEPGPPKLDDGSFLEGATAANPRVGCDVWHGESEAAEILEWCIEEADAAGQLRGILEAVRSHRVEDDFSARWTFAREDFERKLYRKRSKVRVRFVEMTDVPTVQSPESEVVGDTVTADFLALLDRRERQVVVLLNSGVTKLGDVATLLGYRNHSPISKRLNRIRMTAQRFFAED